MTKVNAFLRVLSPLLVLPLLASDCSGGDMSGDLEAARPQMVPVWSPDGARILFTYSDRQREAWASDYIYAVESDGSRLASISDLPADDSWYADYSPSISPDGRWVAFATFRHTKGWRGVFQDFEIARTRLDGSNYRRLTDHDGLDANPVWSPDGTRIAFLSCRKPGEGQAHKCFDIYTMGANGSDVRRITPPTLRVVANPPVWSPNGRHLAFLAFEEGGPVLHTIAADGGDLRRIAKSSLLPAWSPDGTRIAFAVERENERWSVYTARPDGSDLQELREPSGEDGVGGGYYGVSGLSWSLDGSEIRFLGRYLEPPRGDEPSDTTMVGIRAVKTNGSGARTIAVVFRLRNTWLAWSPDDSRIAIRSDDDPWLPGVALYTLAADGSDMRILAREHGGRPYAVNPQPN